MAKHSFRKIPVDPDLRARALTIIEEYKKQPTVTASGSPADLLAACVPVAMKTIGEMVEAYDRGELTVAAHRQLISALKKITKKYGSPSHT